jgi:CHASE3 domain sensor protein
MGDIWFFVTNVFPFLFLFFIFFFMISLSYQGKKNQKRVFDSVNQSHAISREALETSKEILYQLKEISEKLEHCSKK